jgi:hypothetical protein
LTTLGTGALDLDAAEGLVGGDVGALFALPVGQGAGDRRGDVDLVAVHLGVVGGDELARVDQVRATTDGAAEYDDDDQEDQREFLAALHLLLRRRGGFGCRGSGSRSRGRRWGRGGRR